MINSKYLKALYPQVAPDPLKTLTKIYHHAKKVLIHRYYQMKFISMFNLNLSNQIDFHLIMRYFS